MRKKVGGVPVVYLIAGFVLVLVILAWRLKTPAADPAADATTDPTTDGGGAVDTNGDPSTVYPNMPNGTVVVAPQTDPVKTDVPPEDNTDWLRKSVLFLVNKKGHSPGDAQRALNLYLDGENLSYAQGQMRDEAIREYGLPPDPGNIGTTAPKPAPPVVAKPLPTPKPTPPIVARQGNPPCTHTVRGSGDNNLTALIKLYYAGTVTQDKYDLVQAANPSLPSGGPYKVGTKIRIPAYHAPKYFTATASVRTASAIAKKNGISTHTLTILNDGTTKVTFPARIGQKVRVA